MEDDNFDNDFHNSSHEKHMIPNFTKEELEIKYLKALDINLDLKKKLQSEEMKVKQVVQKLVQVLGENKNYYESKNYQNREEEAEILLKEQMKRIKTIEEENLNLKSQLELTRQQLMSSSTRNFKGRKRIGGLPNKNNEIMNPEAQKLLEEAKSENINLLDSINELQSHIEKLDSENLILKDRLSEKDGNRIEEIQLLKSKIMGMHQEKVNDNIQLIKTQFEAKSCQTQLQATLSKVKELEDEICKLKILQEVAQKDVNHLKICINEERKNNDVAGERFIATQSLKQQLLDCEEKLKDCNNENSILRYHNNTLMSSTFNLDSEKLSPRMYSSSKFHMSTGVESETPRSPNEEKLIDSNSISSAKN